MTEQRNPIGYYIGHVNDAAHRYKAASGGIGTMLQKYLLSTGQYGTSITFLFNAEKCMYEPELIYSADEVNICGSIYQDINIAHFVRDHIKEITNGIVVSCPPCQVSIIRNMLKKEGIPCFIISFCCSGQTTIEGTWKYYELLGIKKEDVVNMQYRGNGWPSGIQIWLKDGTSIYRENYTEPWKTLHASWLFRPSRCLYCTYDTSWTADISLADPWIDRYKQQDREGHTLFVINTELGQMIIEQLKANRFLSYTETNRKVYDSAQKNNISKAIIVLNQRKRIRRVQRLIAIPFIHYIFSQNITLMRLFVKLRYML
jgi:coenzyme F420-reducing hydrogenase beta subunit